MWRKLNPTYTKMASKLACNLSQLQNLIKRDPQSYKDEYLQQHSHCDRMLQMLMMSPSFSDENLVSLVMFLAQVSHCYPEIQTNFPQQLYNVLQSQGQLLSANFRMVFCQALIMMRNKGLVTAISLLELFFTLLRCQDKVLRKALYVYMVNDIRKVNLKLRNAKLNTKLQNFICGMLKDNNHTAAKMALDVMIELYRRKIWSDAKTVNAISTALFSATTKILIAGLRFFLGSDEACDENNSEDESEVNIPKKSEKNVKLANRVAKQSKKRRKRMERALQALKKQKRKKNKSESFNFSAIHLLYDPQDLAERLFSRLERTNEKFEIKMMMMNLVSRLVGIHKLIVINFYASLDRFLQPHCRDVTKILMFLAQASHDMVPPEIILSSITTVANNFITERNSSEVMAVGLNAIREVCGRCPLAMSKELLDDLIMYKSHKNKGVSMAARSLINLYREKNPQLLNRSDRGRPSEIINQVESIEYGVSNTVDYVPGAEFLSEEDLENDKDKQDEWTSCSDDDDDDDDDGSWCDVSHSSSDDNQDSNDTAKVKSMNSEERKERARNITESRILTQDDFKKIQSSQIQKSAGVDNSTKSKKRQHSSHEPEPYEPKDVVTLSNIEDIHKKRRHDRESRLETVMAGREGRDKYGRGVTKMNPHASKSNVEKRKQKNFQMVKHKIKAAKGKRSFHEKKVALTNALLRKMKDRK